MVSTSTPTPNVPPIASFSTVNVTSKDNPSNYALIMKTSTSILPVSLFPKDTLLLSTMSQDTKERKPLSVNLLNVLKETLTTNSYN